MKQLPSVPGYRGLVYQRQLTELLVKIGLPSPIKIVSLESVLREQMTTEAPRLQQNQEKVY